MYYKDANGNPLPAGGDQLAAGTSPVINVEEYTGPSDQVVNDDLQLVESGGTIDDYDLATEPEVLGNTAGAGPPRPNNIREVIQKAPNGPLTIKGLKNESPKVIKKVRNF